MTKKSTAQAFAEGRNGRCHNALTDGQTYWLHGHPIAVKQDGSVVFYWHGFYTRTTAAHMNDILRALGADFRVGHARARDTAQTHFVVNGAA